MGRALHHLGQHNQATEQCTSALRVRMCTGERFAAARTRYYLAQAKTALGQNDVAAEQRAQALIDLSGLVGPAADTLRGDLNRLVP